MKRYKLPAIAISLLTVITLSACESGKQKEENAAARAMGHAQAVDLAATIQRDSLDAETLIIDVRARESELRRRGAQRVADCYIDSFLETLDSIAPDLAMELRNAGE